MAVAMILLLVGGGVTLVRIFNGSTDDAHAVTSHEVSNFTAPLSASPTASSSSGDVGSAIYCGQLATIAENAYRTKKNGYPLDQIQALVSEGLAHTPERKIVAQGVIAVIYGDTTLHSAREAYDSVYQECLR